MYAELIGNYKNHRIKSLWDNIWYQEMGTSTIPPRPYLRPALNDNLDKVDKLIKDGVNIAARKVDKG